MRKPLISLLLACIALSVVALRAEQPTIAAPTLIPFNVTSPVDDVDDNPGNGICHTSVSGPAAGLCTLRAAVMEASHTSGPGAIVNVPAGVYTLTISAAPAAGETNGDLDLITPTVGSPLISLAGAGAATTIINANQLDRVLFVHSGRHATISGVTLRNGYSSQFGGGLYNEGTLTVTDSLFSRNYGLQGGGFFNFGTLSLNQSTLSQNSAGNGGGLYNFGALTVRRSTISGNTSLYSGGGIFNFNGLFLLNSTLSGNSTNGDGGGIYNFASTMNVYNSTIVFNEADSDADQNGGSAGGVYNYASGNSIFNLSNTLLAANNVSGAPVYDECTGTLYSYHTNLIGLAGEGGLCTITQLGLGNHPTLNSQFLLGPLANNGGPTWTHALRPGSNAIDGGDPTVGCVDQNSVALAVDQRGAARIFGVRCDIGAYEYRTPLHLPLVVR